MASTSPQQSVQAGKSNTSTIPADRQYPKISKVKSTYMEIDFFKNADLHTGYFCYNCLYFVKPNHCAIVRDEGQDVNGRQSGVIAPHGVCQLWEENPKEAR